MQDHNNQVAALQRGSAKRLTAAKRPWVNVAAVKRRNRRQQAWIKADAKRLNPAKRSWVNVAKRLNGRPQPRKPRVHLVKRGIRKC